MVNRTVSFFSSSLRTSWTELSLLTDLPVFVCASIRFCSRLEHDHRGWHFPEMLSWSCEDGPNRWTFPWSSVISSDHDESNSLAPATLKRTWLSRGSSTTVTILHRLQHKVRIITYLHHQLGWNTLNFDTTVFCMEKSKVFCSTGHFRWKFSVYPSFSRYPRFFIPNISTRYRLTVSALLYHVSKPFPEEPVNKIAVLDFSSYGRRVYSEYYNMQPSVEWNGLSDYSV